MAASSIRRFQCGPCGFPSCDLLCRVFGPWPVRVSLLGCACYWQGSCLCTPKKGTWDEPAALPLMYLSVPRVGDRDTPNYWPNLRPRHIYSQALHRGVLSGTSARHHTVIVYNVMEVKRRKRIYGLTNFVSHVNYSIARCPTTSQSGYSSCANDGER